MNKTRRDVHIYVVARVRVSGVKSRDPEDAIRIVRNSMDTDYVVNHTVNIPLENGTVDYVEYADETQGYLVDEEGDLDYKDTTYWEYDRTSGELKEAIFGC